MKEYSLAEVPVLAGDSGNDADILLKKLLYLRGLKTEAEIEKFLNPDYDEHLHDPFLLNDIEIAAERIISAIKENQKIIIYSDYDADGIPGAVMLRDFFEQINFKNFENYIPHRHNDGFGLHLEAVESFAEKNTRLIITIDCGTADVAQVKKANDLGVDVIITDHHEINGGGLPPALAVINPKRPDSTYPFPHLCGAAVVYKLIQALIQKGDFSWPSGKEKWFLDMAGLATLSDMVPLLGENRIFAYYGLKVLRKSRRPGLRQIFQKLRINQRFLSEDDITFMITPRINAASRMGSADDAFSFLTAKNFSEAEVAVLRLNKINDERKGLVAIIVKEIRGRIRDNDPGIHDRAVVIGNPNWRPSLLGLVANSLVEDFKRPVFLWGRDGENMIKGSCRSDGRADILAVMERTKDCFLEFGGHKMAGGFSVFFEKIHTLPERIFAVCDDLALENKIEGGILAIDGKLSRQDLTPKTFELIEKLSPFGVGNPKPVFLLENLEIKSIKKFGQGGKHVRITFLETDIPGICFFAKPEKFEDLVEGSRVDLAVNLEKSFFMNRPELRLRIVEVFKKI